MLVGSPLKSPLLDSLRGVFGTGLPWESGGGGAPVVATGLRFTTAYGRGTGGDYAEAYRWARVICAPNIQNPQAFAYIAGLDSGGGGSWMIGTESNASFTGYSVGRLTGLGGVVTTNEGPHHILNPAEISRYMVLDCVGDGTNALLYVNGRLARVGRADADTSWTSANPLAINCRPTGVPPTLQHGDVTIFEVQLSTTVPTAAQIRQYAGVAPGTVIPGSTRCFVPSGLSLVDTVGGKTMTITGTVTRHTIARRPRSMGSIWLKGDSHMTREEGPVEADGIRRALLRYIDAQGYFVSAFGAATFTANTTKDYDPRHGGVGGQALGVANGATPSALSTWAATMPTYCATDGGILVEYGSNDVDVRCVTDGDTAAECRDAYLADVDTVVGLCGGYLDAGGPVVITNILKQGSARGNAAMHSAIGLINAELPGFIESLRATYPGLRLVDWDGAITPTQAAANDPAVLYENATTPNTGLHMTAAKRAIAGELCGAAFVSARG